MPAKLNVGASRKIVDSQFGSRGASVYLEVELDHNIVLEPAKLHERIRQLFSLVQHSLNEELQRGQTAISPEASNATKAKPNGQPRHATTAQVRAIYSIAKQQSADLADGLHQRYGVDRPEDLTVKQASAVIDSLKAARIAAAA